MAKGKWEQITLLTRLSWDQIVDTIFSRHNTIEIAFMAERDVAEALLIEEVGTIKIRLHGYKENRHGFVVEGRYNLLPLVFYFWISKEFPYRPTTQDNVIQIYKS